MLFTTVASTLLLAGSALAQYGGGYGSGSGSGSGGASPAASAPAAAQTTTGPGGVEVQIVQVSSSEGSLAYYPNQLTAAAGTMVQFQFHPKNHTVTQSTFAHPCEPISKIMPNVTGFKSGFMPVAANAAQAPVFTIMINDTKPIWIYCGQTGHCAKGMVMAINVAPGPNSFAAFQALAEATGSNSTSTTNSTTATTSTASTSSSSSTSTQSASAATRPITSYAGLAGLFVAGLAMFL